MSEPSSTQALREPGHIANNEGVAIQPEAALPLVAGSTHADDPSSHEMAGRNQSLVENPTKQEIGDQQVAGERNPVALTLNQAASVANEAEMEGEAQPKSPTNQRMENLQTMKDNSPSHSPLDPSESEGMKALNRKHKRFIDNFMSKAVDVQGKLVTLTSNIAKIEFSLDVLDELKSLQDCLKKVVDALRSNFDTLAEDVSQNQDNKDLIISCRLDELSSGTSRLRKKIEHLLKSRTSQTSRYLSQFNDKLEPARIRLKAWDNGTQVVQNKAIKRYFNEACNDIAKAIEQIGELAVSYSTHEIPRVVNSQNRDKEVIAGVTTVSTITSAVTAAILAESLKDENATNLFKAVNAFWFFSLALSIAAVVNSMLDLFRRSFLNHHGFSEDQVPYLVQGWVRTSPRVLLAASIVSFQMGLCLLTFASQQSTATSIITVVITGWSSFALVSTISWFAWHLASVHHSPFGCRSEELTHNLRDLADYDASADQQPAFQETIGSDLESGGGNGEQRHTSIRFKLNGLMDTYLRWLIHLPSSLFGHAGGTETFNILGGEDPAVSSKTAIETAIVPAKASHPSFSRFSLPLSPPVGQPAETYSSILQSQRPPELANSTQPAPLDPQFALLRLRRASSFNPQNSPGSNDDPLPDENTETLSSSSPIVHMAFSSDSKYLAILDISGDCAIYEITEPHLLQINVYRNWYYSDIHWFPASNHIALKYLTYKYDGDSSSFVNVTNYDIYSLPNDNLGNNKRNPESEPKVIQVHQNDQTHILRTITGMVVFSGDSGDDKFTLHYLKQNNRKHEENKMGNIHGAPENIEGTWETLDFPKIEGVSSETIKCFSLTRDDKYMIHGYTQGVETCVAVIDLETFKVLFRMPLSQDLRRIATAPHKEYLIFEYNDALPELWHFNPDSQENMLELREVYQPPRNLKIGAGHVQFAGGKDEMVVYSRHLENKVSNSGSFCLWGRKNGRVVISQSTPSPSDGQVNYVTCSQSALTGFYIAFGFKDGKIEVWVAAQGSDQARSSNSKKVQRNRPKK